MSNRPGGTKHDSEKIRLELIDVEALNGLGRVLTYGAGKYSPDNWRQGFEWRRLIGAALRHLTAFADGQDLDSESGLPHLDHLAACVMFLSAHQKRGYGTDDRVKHKQADAPGAVRACGCGFLKYDGAEFYCDRPAGHEGSCCSFSGGSF